MGIKFLVATGLVVGFGVHAGRAATLTTLTNFSAASGGYGGGTLIADAAGNLYGTTDTGNKGTIFKLSASDHMLTVLGSITAGTSGIGDLVADAAGNLYGASVGFGNTPGLVFKLAASNHSITTLATTKSGSQSGGLIFDAAGNLYGTTFGGGVSAGSVFEISGTSHSLTTIASFGGIKGVNPAGGLVADAAGNLYGTALGGGPSGEGTVFKVSATDHSLTALYAFNPANGVDAPLGPEVGLAIDRAGNLYGTTAYGGANAAGTVFRLSAADNSLTTLASFTPNGPTISGGNYIQFPGALIIDAAGNLFGTTAYGGLNNKGMVYTISASDGSLTPLASFDGTNGAQPFGLYADPAGNLYGTTSLGGTANLGTLFEITNSGFVTAVPEPCGVGVFALASGFMLSRRRRAGK